MVDTPLYHLEDFLSQCFRKGKDDVIPIVALSSHYDKLVHITLNDFPLQIKIAPLQTVRNSTQECEHSAIINHSNNTQKGDLAPHILQQDTSYYRIVLEQTFILLSEVQGTRTYPSKLP